MQPPRLRVCGVSVSEKALYYVFGAQLALSDGLRSAVPLLSGALAGVLYAVDVMNVGALRAPPRCVDFFNVRRARARERALACVRVCACVRAW